MGTAGEAFGWSNPEDWEIGMACQIFWHSLLRIPILLKERSAFRARTGVLAGKSSVLEG